MGFMEKGTTMVAAIAVCAILILSVLVPVIADNGGTVERKTNLNNEGTPVIMGNPAEEYVIQWDSALPGMVKVNGNVTTVYFAAGADATVSPTSKNVTTDLTYGELPIPVRTGYTFDGWYTSTSYTTEVTEDTVVTGTQDRTLYAKWIGNEYTVTFDAGLGTVSPATKTVTYGSAYGELPVPEYTGHIFGGWFDANDNPISSASIVSIADNHTLHAVYTTEQYLISFTTDGNGTVDVPSLTVDYGTAYTISGNTIVIDGTTVTATGTGSYVFQSWTPNTSGTVSGAMTFIANFADVVALTFTAQSPGSVDTAALADVPRGTQYVVSDNTVTITGFGTVTASLPDGYYMIGWDVAQGVGTVTDAMTFTARYEMIEIAKVVCSDNTTWLLTADGKLFGCGRNNNGQQGNGSGTGTVTAFTQRLDTETIADVVCTGSTTWALTTDGKLFGCGLGGSGQQGSGSTSKINTFTQRLDTETITKVVCSTNTTWVITTDGKLFGCGENGNGQQGDGTTTDVTTFSQRLSNETIADVVCSNSTTWALTTDGKLFGCGANENGQQGDGTTTDVTSFTQRLTNETVASIICGPTTTWAVTTDGKLFGCGANENGQQGNGTTTSVKLLTQRLDTETVEKIACTDFTTWAVTTDGKLFGCGRGNNGQQGDGTTTGATSFTQRLSTETIADVVCSDNTTWALTTDGKLFGCGRGNNGQQGDGTTTGATSFTQRLSTETIADVVCSTSTTWALTTDGKLFGCGNNQYGEQGDGTTTDVRLFTQRGPVGSVNIPVAIQPLNVPLNNPHFNPLLPAVQPLSISASAMNGTDYTWHAGGEDWMLCTVSTGQDQYALALFYAGAAEPLLWDEDVTLTFSNGTLSGTNNGTPFTMTYTSIFYKGSGDYLLMTGDAYVMDDTNILGYAIPSAGNGLMVKGTIASLTAENIGGDITVGDAAVVSASTDYDGVSTISEVSAAYNTDQTAVCSSVIVPKKVTVTETVEDGTMKAILSLVPLVLIVGLVLAIVGTFLYKRM